MGTPCIGRGTNPVEVSRLLVCLASAFTLYLQIVNDLLLTYVIP